MELYLLRHGVSVANERRLVCGASDYPLSERGVVQAAIVRRHLEVIPFGRIYTSPLSRAVNTIVDVKVRAPLQIEEELKELDTGDVSHMTLPELWAVDERFRRPWRTPDLRYPGGETFHEMVTRISVWFERHFPTWGSEERVLIVGHEGTLRVIYLRLMGLPLDDYPEFPIGNCDCLYFKLSGWKVQQFRHVTLEKLEGVSE
ncbi:MAG: histidine phosphatase family protein [Betaproteobacteria bacterium]|nr:histidine phosphatase family protein [Betaproteobacteria bacterium]